MESFVDKNRAGGAGDSPNGAAVAAAAAAPARRRSVPSPADPPVIRSPIGRGVAPGAPYAAGAPYAVGAPYLAKKAPVKVVGAGGDGKYQPAALKGIKKKAAGLATLRFKV